MESYSAALIDFETSFTWDPTGLGRQMKARVLALLLRLDKVIKAVNSKYKSMRRAVKVFNLLLLLDAGAA